MTYYYGNWFTLFLYKLVFWRLYKYVDTCLIVVNVVLITLPETYESPSGDSLATTSRVITLIYLARTILMMIAVGWQTCFSESKYFLDLAIATLCLVSPVQKAECRVSTSGVSRLYSLRALFLLGHLRPKMLPKECVIFIKALRSFSQYLGPFLLISGCYVTVVTLLAADLFSLEAYVDPALQATNRDPLVLYGITSLQLLLGSGWSAVTLYSSDYFSL